MKRLLNHDYFASLYLRRCEKEYEKITLEKKSQNSIKNFIQLNFSSLNGFQLTSAKWKKNKQERAEIQKSEDPFDSEKSLETYRFNISDFIT